MGTRSNGTGEIKELILSLASILIPIGMVLGIILLVVSCHNVPVGHLGVLKQWGQVNHEETLEEGLVFLMPIKSSVKYMDVRLRGFDQLAHASSKDLQEVSTKVSVQYSLTNVSHLFQKIGGRKIVEKTLLSPAVSESVKAITAKYTAEHLIKKRPEVKAKIVEDLSFFLASTLEAKGLDKASVSLANVAITEFNFSDEFNKSIEMKVRAEQQALQAKNEKIKKITDAEASAKKIEIESKATAQAILREANALKANPHLIEYRKMEKWDGKLPRITGGYIPMLDVNKGK